MLARRPCQVSCASALAARMCDFVSLDYVEEGFRKDDSEENHKTQAPHH
jgi:hypothetical protein